jgi:hypothetical protein
MRLAPRRGRSATCTTQRWLPTHTAHGKVGALRFGVRAAFALQAAQAVIVEFLGRCIHEA